MSPARGALVAVALVPLAAGCVSQWPSPRVAYSQAPSPAVERDAFQVLDAWDWPDALASGRSAGISRDALAAGSLGLFEAADFRLESGRCADCAMPDAVLWHFHDEVIAVPRDRRPRTGLERRNGTGRQVLEGEPLAHPALVWLGAPELIDDATLAEDGGSLQAGGGEIPLRIVPRLAHNRSYVDVTTARFFAARPLRVRGATRLENGVETFVARTLWPGDARIDAAMLDLQPLTPGETLGTLIEAWTTASPAAFPVRLLWEREPDTGRDWAGRPALAFLLSGSQGDDDGSRGGHLGVATGTFGPRGEWDEWLVDNFYPLDEPNAKGIIPASVPADKYLLDVNSGQLYYRPGYMLVAVLREPVVAAAVHSVLHETMVSHYCGEVRYSRAHHNSTAMSMDAIRGLGWRIPTVGASSRLLGLALAPPAALVGRSFAVGRDMFRALAAEKTRLLPRVAFEVLGHDLLYLAATGADASPGDLTEFERLFAEHVDAVLFVHLPQIPSSRRPGSYPERSLLTYGAHVFTNPRPFEFAPDTEPRPLPDGLEESCATR